MRIEIEHQSSAINGMVVEGAAGELAVTTDSPKLDSHYVKSLGWRGYVYPDEADKGQTKGQQWKQVTHKPICLLAEHPGFNFVAGFRDAPVTGLSWGQFFDLSPEGKRQFVQLHGQIYEISHVLIDTGSVDMSGEEYIVPKEHGRSPGVDRPKISVDPLANLLDLDQRVQAELVLEDKIPLAELLLQIGHEAREELASYEEDQGDVGEEDQDNEDDEDESIPGDEEDESGYIDDAEDENEQGDEDEDDDDMFSIDVGCSDGLDQDPGETREVKVQGGVEEGRVNCKQVSFSHAIDVIDDGDIGNNQSEKSLGAFGTEDVYFYGEVGYWKTARIKDLKFRDVPAEEIPQWSKDRVAAWVRKYVEEDREKEMGNQEAAGDSSKEIGLQRRGSVNSNEEKQERKTCSIDDQIDEEVRAGVVEKGNVNHTQNVRTGYGWRFLGFVKDRVFGTWEEPVGSLSMCWARFYEKEYGGSHVTGDYQDDGKFWLGVEKEEMDGQDERQARKEKEVKKEGDEKDKGGEEEKYGREVRLVDVREMDEMDTVFRTHIDYLTSCRPF
ncbi:hypothetical protein L873DRAFT_1865794 [Choiromyces venosus 120613-1]|uniref:Uncharacterized protein n=1 Tax=Choiromyces venosus 120613-1 TaxID=1336337 RepID=A0A3N4J5R7_9PEZI|nr:hypothetical protein L873DRAFT_1865794 [Choiromyces venosus 120613-1]